MEKAIAPEPAAPPITGTVKDSAGFLNEKGVAEIIENSYKNPTKSRVLSQVLIFRTRKQRTWFAVTSNNIFCVLDDEKTTKAGRQVQWQLPLIETDPVRVRPRADRTTGLVDIGPRRNWLYSQRLHPDAEKLQKDIEMMIQNAQKA